MDTDVLAACTIVLVEGMSDRRAVEALAERYGRDLESEGISIVAMGGAQAIGSVLEQLGPRQHDLNLAGLCELQRFLKTQSGRNVRFAALLPDALDLARVPRPLDRLVASV